MANKLEIIEEIIAELVKAQNEPVARKNETKSRRVPFPAMLPVGNGKHFPATERLLELASDYAEIIQANDPQIQKSISVAEQRDLVARAFGQAFDKLNLANAPDPASAVRDEVSKTYEQMISRHENETKIVLGCWLFDNAVEYPIQIGTVTFDRREDWLERLFGEGRVSITTHRRIKKSWNGEKLRKRKSSKDSSTERDIIEAIGSGPIVCEVQLSNLSSAFRLQKGLTAARLAMTALSLLWMHPSSALEYMRLAYDGKFYLRRYATINEWGFGMGSKVSHMPHGYQSPDPINLSDYRPLLDVVGSILSLLTMPPKDSAASEIQNAAFLSLWWFNQACREQSDQAATVKFAACLDTLGKGKSDKGIFALIEALFGVKKSQKLMTDGRTVSTVVNAVYNRGRSQLIHGSSSEFDKDWSSSRATAEAVSRQCLTHFLFWMSDNPDEKRLDNLLSKKN